MNIKEIRDRNFKGIDNADALILVSWMEPYKFNGANIEVGYAIGRGIPVYYHGSIERSAMYCGMKSLSFMDDGRMLMGGVER